MQSMVMVKESDAPIARSSVSPRSASRIEGVRRVLCMVLAEMWRKERTSEGYHETRHGTLRLPLEGNVAGRVSTIQFLFSSRGVRTGHAYLNGCKKPGRDKTHYS